MFEITKEEYTVLRSQIGTLRHGQHSKYPPMVFTQMRHLLLSHKDLVLKIEKLERGLEDQSDEIQVLFNYLKKLIASKDEDDDTRTRRQIGFKR